MAAAHECCGSDLRAYDDGIQSRSKGICSGNGNGNQEKIACTIRAWGALRLGGYDVETMGTTFTAPEGQRSRHRRTTGKSPGDRFQKKEALQCCWGTVFIGYPCGGVCRSPESPAGRNWGSIPSSPLEVQLLRARSQALKGAFLNGVLDTGFLERARCV